MEGRSRQAREQEGDTSPAGLPLIKMGTGKQLYSKTEKGTLPNSSA